MIKTYGERDAAQRLGVAVRTLRTWVHPDRSRRRSPSKANRSRIGTEHQRNARDVRRATAPRRRMDRLSTKGIRVTLQGDVGPRPDDKYMRHGRRITTDLPPEAAADIMNAYLEDGPEAAAEAFRRAMAEYYVDGDWRLENLSEFQFGDSAAFGDDW
ncbi:hypothetical protein K1T35_47990 (plasmid) [Pseudonocardia sp. DSM 110487]|uniref:hypothetical protein n=1 Tax=Pseudonocardia sp. DSM 110487 TaxID=2865833 RepID=UPI001C697EF0|nr:hypothetical protein [Pseudonocardia sp. DSM 110487]QYN41093.1 hypothetical protein K1T35_47990 [Pseudonocardia sp. DSM 110487]